MYCKDTCTFRCVERDETKRAVTRCMYPLPRHRVPLTAPVEVCRQAFLPSFCRRVLRRRRRRGRHGGRWGDARGSEEWLARAPRSGGGGDGGAPAGTRTQLGDRRSMQLMTRTRETCCVHLSQVWLTTTSTVARYVFVTFRDFDTSREDAPKIRVVFPCTRTGIGKGGRRQSMYVAPPAASELSSTSELSTWKLLREGGAEWLLMRSAGRQDEVLCWLRACCFVLEGSSYLSELNKMQATCFCFIVCQW